MQHSFSAKSYAYAEANTCSIAPCVRYRIEATCQGSATLQAGVACVCEL